MLAEIGQIQNPLAEQTLQNAAAGNGTLTPGTRVAAIEALPTFPSAETQDELNQLQSDTNQEVRSAAAQALQTIQNRFTAP